MTADEFWECVHGRTTTAAVELDEGEVVEVPPCPDEPAESLCCGSSICC